MADKDNEPTTDSIVTLREITAETVWVICNLSVNEDGRRESGAAYRIILA